MRVLVAHNRYSSAQPSGENTVVDGEIAQLRGAGIDVVTLLRASDDIPALRGAAKITLPLSPVYNRSATHDLARLIEAERPDVMHLHNPYPLLSPWIVRTAHRYGVPVVQTIHNYRHVCAAATLFRDGHSCTECVGKRFGTPAIRHRCYRGSAAQSAIMATTLAVHRGTWHSVDRFIALTDGGAAYLRDFGIPADRITVKPNGIADPGPVAPIGDGFLFLGRLSPEKGPQLLLDAWRAHPEGSLGTLRVAGDGPLRDLVTGAAAERADVDYLGPLDAAGVRAAMRATAVVVTPSVWQEVLSTVIIEALASGRPVLGTELGGTPYLVGADSPRPAGWIVPPTAAALSTALPVARAQAPSLSGAARQRYETAFAPEVVLSQLIKVYEQTAARGVLG